MTASTFADRITAALVPPSTAAFFAALDTALDRHQDLMLAASFAPPISYQAGCPCGAVFTIRGLGDLSDDDYTAIRDFDDAHTYCEARE